MHDYHRFGHGINLDQSTESWFGGEIRVLKRVGPDNPTHFLERFVVAKFDDHARCTVGAAPNRCAVCVTSPEAIPLLMLGRNRSSHNSSPNNDRDGFAE